MVIVLKILKNNYNEVANTSSRFEPYPRKLICHECESELEYDESDMDMGVYGCMHVRCPLCGYNNMLDINEKNITLTKDNIEFPTHFHYSSKDNGAVDTCNNKHVKEWIKKCIESLRYSDDDWVHYIGSGNTMVHIYKHEGDGEYYVCVCGDYYDTYIPFESEDYQ